MKFILTAQGMQVQQADTWYDIPARVQEFMQGWNEFWTYVPHDRSYFYQFSGWLFEQITSLITIFPLDLILNERTTHLALAFSGLSVGMVALFSLFESAKAIAGLSYTKLHHLLGRFVFSLIGAGFTIPALYYVMHFLNLMIMALLHWGHQEVAPHVYYQSFFQEAMNDGAGNFVIGILFLIAYLTFSLKTLLQAGRRWFDLIVNAVISPLAWATLTTDATKSFYLHWLHHTTGLLMANLVTAFYLTVITVVVMSPYAADSTAGNFGRLLLVIGSIWRLSSPPTWLRRYEGESAAGMWRGFLDITLLRKLRRFR